MPLSYCSYGQSCEMFNEVLVDSSVVQLLVGLFLGVSSLSGGFMGVDLWVVQTLKQSNFDYIKSE